VTTATRLEEISRMTNINEGATVGGSKKVTRPEAPGIKNNTNFQKMGSPGSRRVLEKKYKGGKIPRNQEAAIKNRFGGREGKELDVSTSQK